MAGDEQRVANSSKGELMRLRGLVCGALLAAIGCGTGAAPAPAMPSPAIAIAGPATLVVGQVLQYTAATTSGQDVTIQSNWTTSDASVATTTHSGVVTAVTTGTVTLTAAYQTSVASTTVVVKPSILSSAAITACGMIVMSGSYFLDGDISQVPAAGLCLLVSASAVHLDCRSHHVSGILVSGASDVTISNCTATGISTSTVSIEVQDSSHVTLDHDSGTTFELLRGHDNAVVESMLDGGYDGRGGKVGADDAIVLGDETNDRIEGNTIQNVWDAAIEGVDLVAGTVITNNTILNTGSAGVASYWCTNWTGNKITRNAVTGSANLMFFSYATSPAKCLDVSTPGAFVNNQIVANTLRNIVAGGAPGALWFDFASLPASAVSENLIQGNDMGAAPGPYTVPASGFINGGGNICGSLLNPFCGGS